MPRALGLLVALAVPWFTHAFWLVGLGILLVVAATPSEPRLWWHYVRTGVVPARPPVRPEAEEDRGHHRVVLQQVGDRRIDVIKEIRVVTGAGLAEAKAMTDHPPSEVIAGVSVDFARQAALRIERTGGQATVEHDG